MLSQLKTAHGLLSALEIAESAARRSCVSKVLVHWPPEVGRFLQHRTWDVAGSSFTTWVLHSAQPELGFVCAERGVGGVSVE